MINRKQISFLLLTAITALNASDTGIVRPINKLTTKKALAVEGLIATALVYHFRNDLTKVGQSILTTMRKYPKASGSIALATVLGAYLYNKKAATANQYDPAADPQAEPRILPIIAAPIDDRAKQAIQMPDTAAASTPVINTPMAVVAPRVHPLAEYTLRYNSNNRNIAFVDQNGQSISPNVNGCRIHISAPKKTITITTATCGGEQRFSFPDELNDETVKALWQRILQNIR